MNTKLIAKILAILYIIFITLFAFDEPLSSIGFLIHLIPTFLLIGVLIFAWFKPKIGGILFLSLGIVFAIFFKSYEEIISFLLIPFPLIIIGILFLFRKKH